MSEQAKIYVAGHRGMVGSAIVRHLKAAGHSNFVTRTHAELDLTNQADVQAFFENEKPDQVYLAAAKVGGIHANNTYPAEFIYENLMMQANIIDAAFRNGVKKLLFLGSSCIYPKLAPQPMREDALLTGTLESTNEPYAIAKIAGIKLCESYNRQYGASHGVDYRSVMPISIVANAHPDIALVLSGGQRHAFAQVQAHVKALRLEARVFFVGYVPDADLAGFYKRARALVMPTFFGPTNIPPLEALALGCPAIVSGIYGMQEQCGDAALYFDPKCPKEMAAQISRVWTDDALAASMSRRGIERSRYQGQAQFNHRITQIIEAVA